MGKYGFLFALSLLVVTGCGDGGKPKFTEEELANMPLPQREGLPSPSGGFVLSVGSDTITSDEKHRKAD